MRNEKERGAYRVILALIVGLALGAIATGNFSGARAQVNNGGYANGQESFDLRSSYERDAAPRVTEDAYGKASFSRPLEVPPLYAFDSPLDESGRQIVLVDAQTKRICVYWIRQRGANSTIELVATRAYELDLTLENFNGEGLTPGQIREQLNGR